MKLKQKAEIQRLLGNIEGATVTCEENVRNVILESIRAIDEILKKDSGKSEQKVGEKQ